MKQNAVTNNPDHNYFDLGHVHRTSLDMGELIPISCIPTLPGDTLNIDVEAFIRGMPTIAPIVDKVDLKINHFYVPYRVLWDRWTEFITQRNNHASLGLVKPTFPTVRADASLAGNYKNGRLADYLGVAPNLAGSNAFVSAMPFLAYYKIFIDHYSPKTWVNYGGNNVYSEINKLVENVKRTSSGGNIGLAKDFSIQKVGWNHDYFSNALPSPTLFGDVKIPTFVDKDGDGEFGLLVAGGSVPFSDDGPGAGQASDNYNLLGTIRDLRNSISVQHYLEKLAVSGGGYRENLKVFWGQDTSNKELQMSEYLGGSTIPLFVNEVEATASSATNNLGDLAGKPLGAGRFDNVNIYCDEFGIYMCIAHISPKRTYGYATNKAWFAQDVMDFPNPEFENIGDQAVFNYELSGNFATGQKVFGYVPRYSEYKSSLDRFSGEMRNTLKHWHLGEMSDLSSAVISPQFLECNPRVDIFKVPNEPDKFLGTFKINIDAKRKLQVNANPGLTRI